MTAEPRARRARLIARLGAGAALTVVRDPAGSGASALITAWLGRRADRGVPAVRVALDRSAADRAGFWRRVVEAVLGAGTVDAAPSLGDVLPALDGQAGLRHALARGFGAMTGGLLVVLDDFHVVTDPRVGEDVIALLRDCPAVSLVVSTRARGRLEDDDVGVCLDRVLIGPEDLVPTAGDPVPAGVESHEPLREVDERLRSFLLATSVPPELTEELAARLSRHDDAGDLLRRAEELGLGAWTDSLDPSVGEPRFRYADGTRRALGDALAALRGPEAVELRRTVARWAVEHGEPLTALRAVLEGGDLAAAEAVVGGHWYELATDHGDDTRALLAALPTRVLLERPVLALLLGSVQPADAVGQAAGLYAMVAAVVARRVEACSGSERVALLATQCVALRFAGRGARAVDTALRCRDLLAELPVEARDALGGLLPTIRVHVGITLFGGGRLDEALELFAAVLALGRAPAVPVRVLAASFTAAALALTGDRNRAEDMVSTVRAIRAPRRVLDGPAGTMCHVAQALVDLEDFALEDAERHLSGVTDRHPGLGHEALIACVRSVIDLGRNRVDRGLETLDEVLERGGGLGITDLDTSRVRALRALLLLAAGRPGEAGEEAGRGLPDDPWTVLVGALQELLVGQVEAAAWHLDQALERDDGRMGWRGCAFLVRAACLLSLEQDQAALEDLERAAVALVPHGRRLPLVLLPRRDLDALRALCRMHGNPDVWALLADVSDVPSVMPSEAVEATLTSRELAAVCALATAGSIRDVAASLGVTVNTVKSQLRRAYAKLGVGSRAEAVAVAHRCGWVR